MSDDAADRLGGQIGGLISDVMAECFFSPNEADRNGEKANVVDGLFAIARGLEAIATAIRERR